MSSQQRVQSYLDRHRINALFEDLMARLVHNLPAEPVPYLIKILQKFEEKAKKPFQENPLAPKAKSPSPALSQSMPKPSSRAREPLSKSTTSLHKDTSSKGATHLTKDTSRSVSQLTKDIPPKTATSPSKELAPKGAYGWQSSSLSGVYGEDRGYERPWVANMKKIKYDQSKARKLKKSSSTGGGDADSSSKSTPSSEADVDQIFTGAQERPSKSKVLFSPAAQAWISEQDNEPYRPPPPMPYQPPQQVEEAFLKEEMSSNKLTRRYEKEVTTKEAVAEKLEQRHAKPEQKAKKHKEELAALVEAQRKVETLGYLDSGGDMMDPDQGGYEEATDLLEDASDLMDEGITNVKTTGQKTRRRQAPPVTQVKVGVCSRCANVVSGGDTTSGVGLSRGYGAYASIDSASEVSASTEEDFESASQVTGPRPMAWEGTGVDDARSAKSVTARSLTHDQTSELFQSASRGRSRGPAGGDTFRLGSSTEVRSSHRQAWETKTYTSETEVDRRVTGTDSLLNRGRSWPQPGSDDDSSV